jgi:hypothetical protein
MKTKRRFERTIPAQASPRVSYRSIPPALGEALKGHSCRLRRIPLAVQALAKEQVDVVIAMQTSMLLRRIGASDPLTSRRG